MVWILKTFKNASQRLQPIGSNETDGHNSSSDNNTDLDGNNNNTDFKDALRRCEWDIPT